MTEPDEILVVDDDYSVLNVLTDILSAEGYSVRSAKNGQLALDLIEAKPPHMILLDIIMSGIDGFEVCRQLQAREETRKIPVIFLSGILGFEDKVKAFKVGGADFITKPFEYGELLARVRTHLGLSQLRTRLEAQDAERTAQLRKLQESEKRFRLISETIEEVFWMSDIEIQRMFYVSPSYELMWGRSRQSLYDNPKSFLESIHPEDQSRVLSDLEAQKIGQPFDHEYRIIRFDGSIRWIWDRGFPVPSEGEQVTLYVGIASDISQRKRAEEVLQQVHHEQERRVAKLTIELKQANEELQREITDRKLAEEALKTLSLRDDLTGLYNRRGFFALAEQGLKTAQRMGTKVFLIFGDLDNLKGINDSLGHKEGDHALMDISQILKRTFRESDIIARIGGDEFVILVMNSLETLAKELIDRFKQGLNDHYLQKGHAYKLSMSFGIVSFNPQNPCSIDVLLAQADKLMYENKKKRGR